VADSNGTLLKALKARMAGVRVFDDHKALLRDGGIDAAVIATPTGAHVEVALDCVGQGIPVFIEKPLALSGRQAQPLLEALARRPVANMVGYMGRYIETFAKAKAIVTSGALGRRQMLRSSMYVALLFRAGKGWRYDKGVSGGGVLITQNSHLVDKLLWLFGDVRSVSAHTGALYSPTVEDHAHLVFAFASGLTGFMDASWSARHFRTPAIAIHVQGEAGTLDVDDDSVRLFLDAPAGGWDAGWSEWRKPDLYEGVSFDSGGPQYTLQAEAFLAAVRGGPNPESDVRSAWRAQCVIDAAYLSAERGGAPVAIGTAA
jgi:predicted dehydrogenase